MAISGLISGHTRFVVKLNEHGWQWTFCWDVLTKIVPATTVTWKYVFFTIILCARDHSRRNSADRFIFIIWAIFGLPSALDCLTRELLSSLPSLSFLASYWHTHVHTFNRCRTTRTLWCSERKREEEIVWNKNDDCYDMILPIVLYLYVAGKWPIFILHWAKLIGLAITLLSINTDLFFLRIWKKVFQGRPINIAVSESESSRIVNRVTIRWLVKTRVRSAQSRAFQSLCSDLKEVLPQLYFQVEKKLIVE